MNELTKNRVGIGISIGTSLVAAVLLTMHLSASPSQRLDTIGFSLVVLGILPWLIPFLGQYLESGEFFGQKFKFLQAKVESQDKIIQLIREALRRNLTKHEYQHLVELASGADSLYKYCDFLEKEMIRLCQHGYVRETFHNSTWMIKYRGDDPFYLTDFYKITEEGKKYLELIKSLKTPIK